MEKLRNLGEDLKIDKFNLDIMAERMPELIQYWGQVKVEAESAKDRLYANYKLLKNEKNLAYRKNPPEGVKITESVIDSLVESDKDVVKAHSDFLDAQENYATYEVAFTAIRDKSSRVRDEISLWLGGYFGDSRQSEAKKANARNIIED